MSHRDLKEIKPQFKAITLVGGTSLTFIIPKSFCDDLELQKGDYVKITPDGKRLIVERAD
jgi:hypothetical protein